MGELLIRKKSPLVYSICMSVSVAGMVPSPALLAQERSEASEYKAEGRVIYSRDVPDGAAIGPRTPSTTDSVVTGPTNLLLKTMAKGLEVLGDAENAGVVATVNSQTGLLENKVLLGMGVLNGTQATSPSASQNGSIQGSVVGNAIGQATGAIQDAMASLRNAPGGGK